MICPVIFKPETNIHQDFRAKNLLVSNGIALEASAENEAFKPDFMEVSVVDSLNIQVLRGFGLKPKSVRKEKSYFVCSTDKGLKTIRRTNLSHENILFQHELKERLFSGGFAETDRFGLSVHCLPYFDFEDEVYTITDNFPLREAVFSNGDDFRLLVRAVSKMHSVGKYFSFEAHLPSKTDFDLVYRKNSAALRSVKKRVLRQSALSDFDVVFLKDFDFMLSQLDEWHCFVMAHGVSALVGCGGFAHNNLKEENLLFDGQRVYITDFSSVSPGSHVRDLADIIKRYQKKADCLNIDILSVIKLYGEVNALTRNDLLLLYSLLKYPERYLRLCFQYYEKKRTWTPAAFTTRLQALSSTKHDFNAYIERLRPFVLKEG